MKKEVVAHANRLPKTIKVGGHNWRIALQDDWAKNDRDENCWGICDPRSLSLVVANLKEVPTSSVLVGTFLHELLHAIWFNQRIAKNKEETIISGLENGLIGVFTDNPWLLDWIKKGLK